MITWIPNGSTIILIFAGEGRKGSNTHTAIYIYIPNYSKRTRCICYAPEFSCCKYKGSTLKVRWRHSLFFTLTEKRVRIRYTVSRRARLLAGGVLYAVGVCIFIYHMAVQSKCTIIHLLGLNAMESAYATPVSQCRNSGHMNAVPAYAASTWNHMSSAWPEKTSSGSVNKTRDDRQVYVTFTYWPEFFEFVERTCACCAQRRAQLYPEQATSV